MILTGYGDTFGTRDVRLKVNSVPTELTATSDQGTRAIPSKELVIRILSVVKGTTSLLPGMKVLFENGAPRSS
jgi:hypothetical protein